MATSGLAELDRIDMPLQKTELHLSNPSQVPSSRSLLLSLSRPSGASSRLSPPPLHSPPASQIGSVEEVPAARVDAAIYSRLQPRHLPSSPTLAAARSTPRPLPSSFMPSSTPPPTPLSEQSPSMARSVSQLVHSTTSVRGPSSSSSPCPAPPTSQPCIRFTKPTVSQTLLRLAQPRNKIYAERERQREEREIAKTIQENCTFKPNLCQGTEKRAAAAAAASKGEVPKSLPDRLKEKQEAAEAARLRRQEKLELELAAECTFRPVLYTDEARLMSGSTFWSSPLASPCSSPLRRPGQEKPLHQRLGDVQRARRDNLNRLRAREEKKEAAEWTFSPRLCSVSEEIARQRRQEQDYQKMYDQRINDEKDQPQSVKSGAKFDYLAYESQRFLQRRIAKQLDLEQEQLAECHFSPRLCEKTEKLIAHAGLPLDFESRQYVWKEQRQRKAAVIEANKAAEEDEWFRPALKPYSEAIVARLRLRLDQEDINRRHTDSNSNSDDDPVVQRLAVKEIARREAARLHRTEAFYAQYLFQPSLNPVSRALGRPSTTDELAYNWRGEMARNKAFEEAQERFEAECTFQPVLQSSYSSSSLPLAASAPTVPVAATSKAIATRCRQSLSTSALVAIGNVSVPATTKIQLRQPSSLSIAGDWEVRRRDKESLAAKAHAAREAEELQDCTWQPELATKAIPTRRRQKQQQSPVLVRGLGKFIARTQAAAQQREERAIATAALAAGGTKRTGVTTNSGAEQVKTTMARPFQISSRPQGQRGSRASVRAEVEKLAQATLTFRPKTIERRKRAALQNMLEGGVSTYV